MKSSYRNKALMLTVFVLLFSCMTAGTLSGAPQVARDSAEAKTRLSQFEKYKAMRAKSQFKDLKWTAVGPMRPSGRMVDVEVHPSEPKVVYAAAAQGGVWKSTDDGETWTGIFEDYPTASIGDLAIAPSNPKIVWVGTGEANIFRSSMAGIGIYKSVDAGQHFTYSGLADTQHIARILVHPSNPDIVYVAAPGHEYTFNPERGVYKTTNAGKTWENVKGSHADYHGMWINPKDSNHILVVNDGGIMISHDGLAGFKRPLNIPIGHLFTIAVSQTKGKFTAYSNIQDTGGWKGEIDMTSGRDKITWKEWESAPGDEAGRHAVNPVDPNIVYFVTRYGGGPFMVDFSKAAAPQPAGQAQGGRGGRAGQTTIAPNFGSDKKRSQWVSPIIVSPHDPNRVLYGAQFLFLTNDQGKNWKKISPDLTNYDPAKQGNIAYSTIWAISESPLKKGLIYAGTDDGNLHVTKDEGATWDKISTGLPPERFIASIEASRYDEGIVYVVVNGKRHNDFKTYLFKSTNYGKTWTNIATSVAGGIANVVKEDPTNRNILYLGTDVGVFVSVDGGKKWQVLGSNLPTCYVFDLAIQTAENVAVIGTHGRSAFVVDLLPVRAAARK